MSSENYYKTRLRPKGQVTIPAEVRSLLDVGEGDDLIFRLNEDGTISLERALVIPPDQAWFWTKRWQRMEKAAQADIETGQVDRYQDIDKAISALESLENAED
jgi:AbrB family looped-hinge helix DNA binding protein